MSQWLRPERGWGLTNCIRRSCARFYTAKPRASLTRRCPAAVRSGILFRRYVEFIQHLTLPKRSNQNVSQGLLVYGLCGILRHDKRKHVDGVEASGVQLCSILLQQGLWCHRCGLECGLNKVQQQMRALLLIVPARLLVHVNLVALFAVECPSYPAGTPRMKQPLLHHRVLALDALLLRPSTSRRRCRRLLARLGRSYSVYSILRPRQG
jgi:hypothetical protein